ncbi:hypothetical protein J7T55_013264 [Diaporthe amygdali]|uniref:uncharacterized protein n=1 Tax=Phomopsis amygdali TaxID=1214568 RepID=UPI0022FE8194|nr:uncharacterized protein J7T55_013264 [Diaporthe amygdali]KAJ0119029.1 hypothetical protein J7T55_013264 [Diaporthe amygdali]
MPARISDSCSLSRESTIRAGCVGFLYGGMTTTTSDSDTVSGFHGAGPLTTVFTTPDFCASLYWTDTVTPPLSSLVCMPPKFHSLYDYSFGFYSPGICPTGYSKGCDFPVDRARTDDLGEVYYGGAVLKGETVRVCCPTGYTCLLNDPYSYSKCVHTTDDSELAFALQVRWQESDLSILATDPTVPGSTYSAPATATATPATIKSTAKSGSNIDATATPTPSSSSSTTVTQNENPGSTTQGGLSSGSTIAIALGVGGMVFAFAISALIFFIWRQRRKRRENEGTRIESTVFGDGDSKSSPDGFAPDRKAELDSRALASSTALSEAQAERDAVEMPPLHIAATEMEITPTDCGNIAKRIRSIRQSWKLETAVCSEGAVSAEAFLSFLDVNVYYDNDNNDRGQTAKLNVIR